MESKSEIEEKQEQNNTLVYVTAFLILLAAFAYLISPRVSNITNNAVAPLLSMLYAFIFSIIRPIMNLINSFVNFLISSFVSALISTRVISPVFSSVEATIETIRYAFSIVIVFLMGVMAINLQSIML
jgi:hypothetical protein